MIIVGTTDPPPPPLPPQGPGGDQGDDKPDREVIRVEMDASTGASLKLGNVERGQNSLCLNFPVSLGVIKHLSLELERAPPVVPGIIPDRRNLHRADTMILLIIAAIPELYRDSKDMNLQGLEKALSDSIFYGPWIENPYDQSVNKIIAALYTIFQTRARLDSFPDIADEEKPALHQLLYNLMLHTLGCAWGNQLLTEDRQYKDLQDRFLPITGSNKYIAEFVASDVSELEDARCALFGLELADDEPQKPKFDVQLARAAEFESAIEPIQATVLRAKQSDEALWADPFNNLARRIEGAGMIFVNSAIHDIAVAADYNETGLGLTLVALLEKLKEQGYEEFVFDSNLFDIIFQSLARFAGIAKDDLQKQIVEFLRHDSIDDFANFMRFSDGWKNNHRMFAYVALINLIKSFHKGGITTALLPNRFESFTQLDGLNEEKAVLVNLPELYTGDGFVIEQSTSISRYRLDSDKELYKTIGCLNSPRSFRAALIQDRANSDKNYGDADKIVALDGNIISDPIKNSAIEFQDKRIPDPDLIICNLSPPDSDGGGRSIARGTPGGNKRLVSQ